MCKLLQYFLFGGGGVNVYCLHKFSKYIPYKLSIDKQWYIVDAWGLDLQNYI